MASSALLATTILTLAAGLYLLQECRFLIPFKKHLWHEYGAAIGLYASAVFLNLFAAIYVLFRKLLLKDTGRKLAHLERDLKAGSISAELAERLKDQ